MILRLVELALRTGADADGGGATIGADGPNAGAVVQMFRSLLLCSIR